jgi:hypothetical protein
MVEDNSDLSKGGNNSFRVPLHIYWSNNAGVIDPKTKEYKTTSNKWEYLTYEIDLPCVGKSF